MTGFFETEVFFHLQGVHFSYRHFLPSYFSERGNEG